MPDDLNAPLDHTLPGLTGEQALAIVRTLQQIMDAVWRVYGDEMSYLICRDEPIVQRADRDEIPDLESDDLPF